MRKNVDHLADRARRYDTLEVMTADPSLPLLIARVNPDEPFTADDLVGELKERRGWLVPAYALPPDNQDQRIIRILVKINQTWELADALAEDVHASITDLRKRAKGEKVARRAHHGHGY
jgi:glutamate decarboxylase